MVEFLYNIDVQIFYFINHTLSNPVFDKFFPFITEVKHWYIAYLILWLILFFKGGRIGKIAAVILLFQITFSDQLSSFFIKNLVQRIRPCNALPDVNILVTCTGSYSFPSSHAVNNFAVAMFIYKIYPKLKWILFSSAFLIALSRPYVGVHYPSDILGGAIIGIIIGYLFGTITIWIDSKFSLQTTKITKHFDKINFR